MLPKENFMPRFVHLLRLAGATALLASAPLAHAQYAWIGANGVRHFSDRPPPPSTPLHKIIKAPGQAAPAPESTSAAASSSLTAAGPSEAVAATPPPKRPFTLAEREAAYRERVKLREEQGKKDQQDAQRQRELGERCQSARQVKVEVASGARIGRIDAGGERSYMTDEEKAAAAARADKILAECR